MLRERGADLSKMVKPDRARMLRVDMTNAQAAYDYVLQVWV